MALTYLAQEPVIKSLPLEDLKPNPFQARKDYSGEEELAGSIATAGLSTPLKVRLLGEGNSAPTYEIIDGHRRFRAALKAEYEQAQCLIYEGVTDDDMRLAAAISNFYRPLTFAEQVQEIKTLLDSYGDDNRPSIAQLAEYLGRTPRWIAARYKVAKLKNDLCKALLKLPDLEAYAEDIMLHRPQEIKAALDSIKYQPNAANLRDRLDGNANLLSPCAFDVDDPELLVEAKLLGGATTGTCQGCAFRSGNGLDLFESAESGIQEHEKCLLAACYEQKLVLQLEKHKAQHGEDLLVLGNRHERETVGVTSVTSSYDYEKTRKLDQDGVRKAWMLNGEDIGKIINVVPLQTGARFPKQAATGAVKELPLPKQLALKEQKHAQRLQRTLVAKVRNELLAWKEKKIAQFVEGDVEAAFNFGVTMAALIGTQNRNAYLLAKGKNSVTEQAQELLAGKHTENRKVIAQKLIGAVLPVMLSRLNVPPGLNEASEYEREAKFYAEQFRLDLAEMEKSTVEEVPEPKSLVTLREQVSTKTASGKALKVNPGKPQKKAARRKTKKGA